jgi:hypothetical protein
MHGMDCKQQRQMAPRTVQTSLRSQLSFRKFTKCVPQQNSRQCTRTTIRSTAQGLPCMTLVIHNPSLQTLEILWTSKLFRVKQA